MSRKRQRYQNGTNRRFHAGVAWISSQNLKSSPVNAVNVTISTVERRRVMTAPITAKAMSAYAPHSGNRRRYQ